MYRWELRETDNPSQDGRARVACSPRPLLGTGDQDRLTRCRGMPERRRDDGAQFRVAAPDGDLRDSAQRAVECQLPEWLPARSGRRRSSVTFTPRSALEAYARTRTETRSCALPA